MLNTELLDGLPPSYLSAISCEFKRLTTEAIDNDELEVANVLIQVALGLKAKEPPAPPAAPAAPVITINRRATTQYDEGVKLIKDGIIHLIQNNLINLSVDITSKTFYSLIEENYLNEVCLDAAKLSTLLLNAGPPSTIKPMWKHALIQTISDLMAEGYLVKKEGCRNVYCWTTEAGRLANRAITTTPEVAAVEEEEEVAAVVPLQLVNFQTKPKVFTNNGIAESLPPNRRLQL